MKDPAPLLSRAATYGQAFRSARRPLHPTATAGELRRSFCRPLPDAPVDGRAVLDALIAAAEPGLVGNTDPEFYAWVMGGSDPLGVAADWLTSVWGQNAAIFQCAPAAAIAEEAVSAWLLDLLDLPRTASVGFVTGATMAAFTGLAAARTTVLARAGHDLERDGLQSAPFVRFYLSDDAHATNLAAIRFLGFGEANVVRVPSGPDGLMRPADLASAMDRAPGPAIVVMQAGHINSGGFEDARAIAEVARARRAWVHVDGAFGLWARVLPEKSHLTQGLDLADSWSVDGHKWLQIPYDSGFAIVRDSEAHRRAMDITAGYLNHSPGDGRNPTEFNPELSRRARGFAAWAVLMGLGRNGVRDLVRRHCDAAFRLAERLGDLPGLSIVNNVDLNQVVVACDPDAPLCTEELADALNLRAGAFVRTATWKGRTVLRFSIISQDAGSDCIDRLADEICALWDAAQVRKRATGI